MTRDVNEPRDDYAQCSGCGKRLDSARFSAGAMFCDRCRHTHCECVSVPEPVLGVVVHRGVRLVYTAASESIARAFVESVKDTDPETHMEPALDLVEAK